MSRRLRLVMFTLAALSLVAGLVALPDLLSGGASTSSLLSPGALSSGHAAYEGEENCTKCHVQGSGLDDGLCLDCHEPLAQRIAGKKGYHAQVEGACNACHSEHHGRDYESIRWPPKDSLFAAVQAGKATAEDFDHERGAGFPLANAHRIDCDRCHQGSLIVDGGVVEFKKEEHTYLGLGTDCGSCHLNVHVPSQGDDCGKCHGDEAWSPAPEFDHGKTRYVLVGKHIKIKCEECHLLAAPKEPPPAPPPPIPTFKALVAKTQPRPFRGVGFGKAQPVKGEALPECLACHENPHRAGAETTFGACVDCHTADSWQQAESATFDHGATSFPLDGGHVTVKCADCHGKALGEPARRTCAECHSKDDRKAHRGGFDREMAVARQSCEQCHSTSDWKRSTYVAKKHPLPLIERHDVKCEKCHGSEANYPRLPARPPAAIGPLEEACDACHEDPHKAKLGRDCASCHGFKGWHLAEFDNKRHAEIGFPIVDAHVKASCEGCHGGRTPEGGLRKMALAEVKVQGCVACHEDTHQGQLSQRCDQCHDEKVWTPSQYDEGRHAKSRMALEGAHLAVPCSICHKKDLPGGVQRFKWETKEAPCSACHDDVHKGQFGEDGCKQCHGQEVWTPSLFDKPAHERAGFPLTGVHDTDCAKCHVSGFRHGDAVTYRDTPEGCAGCHEDVHAGQFSERSDCKGCHTDEAWSPTTFDHDKSNYPLRGAHVSVGCVLCHVKIKRGAREVTHYYPIAERECDDCHVNPHSTGEKGEGK